MLNACALQINIFKINQLPTYQVILLQIYRLYVLHLETTEEGGVSEHRRHKHKDRTERKDKHS